MTAESDDDIMDSLFHGCAWAAYLDQAAEEQSRPPNSVATRQRAYRYYEETLAEKNRRKPIRLDFPTNGGRRVKGLSGSFVRGG